MSVILLGLAFLAGGSDPDPFALAINLFAIAFHFELLQVGRQTTQTVAVGNQRAAGHLQIGAVPHVHCTQPDRQIGFQRRVGKVLIHVGCTGKKLAKTFCADGHRDNQPNG